MAIQYNFRNLEGRTSTKPSTSSATVKPDFGNQPGMIVNHNMDAFSELTANNNYTMNNSKPVAGGGQRMKITPLYVPGGHEGGNKHSNANANRASNSMTA
jgi:hypothetical protein